MFCEKEASMLAVTEVSGQGIIHVFLDPHRVPGLLASVHAPTCVHMLFAAAHAMWPRVCCALCAGQRHVRQEPWLEHLGWRCAACAVVGCANHHSGAGQHTG